MARRSADEYRTSKPSLGDVLAATKADTAVVTIKEVKDQKFTDPTRGERLALVIVTEEYPDNPFFPNSGRGGSVDTLFDSLGDDQAAWVGERVPLVRVRDVYNPTTKTRADKFHVAPADEWDAIFKDFDRAQRAGRAHPKGKR